MVILKFLVNYDIECDVTSQNLTYNICTPVTLYRYIVQTLIELNRLSVRSKYKSNILQSRLLITCRSCRRKDIAHRKPIVIFLYAIAISIYLQNSRVRRNICKFVAYFCFTAYCSVKQVKFSCSLLDYYRRLCNSDA